MTELLLIVLCVLTFLSYRRQKKYHKDFIAIEDHNRNRWGDTWTLVKEHETKLEDKRVGDWDG